LGLEELIHTLKQHEQKQTEDIWQAAKHEAESLRQQITDAIADISQKQADQLAAACQKSMRAIYSETEMKTRGKKLLAYNALGLALLNEAKKMLPFLRQQNYEVVFARLVAELPERKWQRITVNPADRKLAEKFFAPDTIASDPDICGGLVASAAEGKITVDNTFTKRLETKWLYMLPAILAKIEQQYGKTRAPANIG